MPPPLTNADAFVGVAGELAVLQMQLNCNSKVQPERR